MFPFVYIIAKSIWGAINPTINNTIEDIFPEKTGSFEYEEISLKDMIYGNNIYSLTYLIGNGYVRCRIIGKDGSSYQTIYLHIDKDVYNLLKKNLKKKWNIMK